MSMPKVVHLPNPEDFCRYSLEHGNQCCFLGWEVKLFPDMDFQESEEFDRVAMKVAKQMRLKHTELLVCSEARYNDHPGNSTRRLATWFRKTIEGLGYEVE
jgi:hypothetical protein